VITTIETLVNQAREGDRNAWHELVREHSPIVWAVTRAHRLNGVDAADASQNTWLALAENLTRIRKPDRLPGWLATTARRECVRILLQGRREVPLEDVTVTYSGPEHDVLRTTRDELLWRAFAGLPTRCRQLLTLVAHAPELTYVQLSRAVGLKVSSLGRTRTRCLTELRHLLVALGGGPE
jgi:RNA polymerase sigma factor (sigma-70 family)